jgi:hypothetical protein
MFRGAVLGGGRKGRTLPDIWMGAGKSASGQSLWRALLSLVAHLLQEGYRIPAALPKLHLTTHNVVHNVSCYEAVPDFKCLKSKGNRFPIHRLNCLER